MHKKVVLQHSALDKCSVIKSLFLQTLLSSQTLSNVWSIEIGFEKFEITTTDKKWAHGILIDFYLYLQFNPALAYNRTKS